jgi:hypothetical protein
MRRVKRPRHEASGAVLSMLRPLLRFSIGRDAYVLRGIGSRYGPVFVRRPPHDRGGAQRAADA